MSGTVVRALGWDDGYEQQFIAVSPLGDEVSVYQTTHDDPLRNETNDMVKLVEQRGFDNIQCTSYSTGHKGLMGVGSLSGTVSIFDINNPSIVVKLRPKQQRPCNSLSFNGKNLVAAGFDKGRIDSSLQIWDLEQFSRGGMTGGGNIELSLNDIKRTPTHSFFPNDPILSTAFYPDKETSLLCGAYKYIREVDIRQELPTFHLSTKYPFGPTVNPFDSRYFTSYGDDGTLVVWDRRKFNTNGTKSGTMTSSSASETPVLLFEKSLSDGTSKRNLHTCIRHSTIRKGEFAALFNGDLIRRWNTGVVNAVPGFTTSPNVKKFTKDDPSIQNLKAQAYNLYKSNEDSLLVSIVLEIKTDYERVISFDYSPDTVSTTSTNFVCMRQGGSVFRMPVVESIEGIDFNSYNSFTFVGPEGAESMFINSKDDATNTNLLSDHHHSPKSLGPTKDSDKKSTGRFDPLDDLRRGSETELSEDIGSSVVDDESVAGFNGTQSFSKNSNARTVSRGRLGSSFQEEFEEEENYLSLTRFLSVEQVFTTDICHIIRHRAKLGYGVNCEDNILVLEDTNALSKQLFLRNTWKWISLAKRSLDKGTMISDGIDLGFQGVLGIWEGGEEIISMMPKNTNIETLDEKFSQAVKSIVSKKGKTAKINVHNSSEKKSQRKLCLMVSGWYFTEEELDERLNLLIELGFVEKAAGWAVFYGDVPRAIEILASSTKERLRIMSTAVAGYLAYKDSHFNSPWKDQCRKMASDLDDPYLRAIFAFIADNDWWDVLDEHSLPLRERLGIALRFLSDKDLTVYLRRVAETVVTKGELEGLILTGITPRGVTLLLSYVDRTSDIQTAALIGAFACPRYFIDERVEHWADSYRELLNSWKLFKFRAKFDVARAKLSKASSGEVTIVPPPKQVYLQCIRCNKNIAKGRSSGGKSKTVGVGIGVGGGVGGQGGSAAGGVGGTGGNGGNNNPLLIKQFSKMNLVNSRKQPTDFKVCPHCGAPLPRCSICLLSLGTPIPLETNETLPETTLGNKIENKFREWFSFCLNCSHGYHSYHAEEWFSKHYVCPVPDCNCRCGTK
ncbi:uncharacterized protein KQ657_004866 [Scheffersomyces spartinae]|uniref:Uncharacterized protein n=1 Tax=Scheffersomyces spartinae TaxID=45513 RepID=A0A9P8AI96_9ASCO|nr:uncharacterized protein KQ657_004866 [Scheffersomyces spartinae]KAG7194158.1 hypothetical protein KQ657_004866 [Scheffersomyces spartinae]